MNLKIWAVEKSEKERKSKRFFHFISFRADEASKSNQTTYMGKMFNKVVKAVNKSDEIFKRKQKIDKLAKGVILTKEEHQDLNTLRAEYLTETDEIAREQSKLNLEFDVKYHNCAINFIDREIEWWENRKKKEVKE